VPFIPCYNINFDSTQSLPSSRKKKGNGKPVGGRGLVQFIPMFQSGQSPCLPFLWIGPEREAALGQAKTFFVSFFSLKKGNASAA